MKEHEIIERLQRAITDTPIDLLEKLQNTDVVKMSAHDAYTKQDEPQEKKRAKVIPFTRFKPMLAAAMLVMAIGLSWMWAQMPVTTLFLDINPSVALTLTRFHKVKEARAYNADGERLLQTLDLKGMDREEALRALRAALPDAQAALLSVDTGENRRQEETDTAVRVLREDTQIVLSQAFTPTDTGEADAVQFHISPGKLELVKKALQAGSIRQPEQLAEMPIDELIAALYEEAIDIHTLVRVDGDTTPLEPKPTPPMEIIWPEPETEPPVTEPPATEPPVQWEDDDDWDDDDWDDDDWDDDDWDDDDWDDDDWDDDDWDDDDWDDDDWDDDDWDDDDWDDDDSDDDD